MIYHAFPTPFGRAIVNSEDGEHINGLRVAGQRYFAGIPAFWQPSNQALFRAVEQQLAEYLAGQRRDFDVPVQPLGTPFQQKVWQQLEHIPFGQTRSYAAIADAIGQPAAVRAVGTAIGRNPICIIVPCHRVLASSGGLGGYVAGLDMKRQLLALEQTA